MPVRFLRAAAPVLPLRVPAILVTIMLGAALVPQAAIGQDKLPRGLSSYVFQDDRPSKLATAAFEQPYGRAIASAFGAALAETADPECLRKKRLTKEQLSDRARAILVARGTYLLEHVDSMTDPKVFRRYLRARIGNDGVAEVDLLRKDPLVRAYLSADEPARLAYLASYIVENVSRFAMLSRITFARPFDPIASEIPSIDRLDPTAKVDADLKELVAADKSGKLSRYLELVLIAQKPYRDAVNMDIARQFGPRELLARPGKGGEDFQDELAGLCAAKPAEK